MTVEGPTGDEVRRRRAISEQRFRNILNGKERRPKFLYKTDSHLAEMANNFRTSDKGTIIVSMHTQAYFFLLDILDNIDVPCIVITDMSIGARLLASNYKFPKNISFKTGMDRKTIRKVLNKECVVFIMADVLLPKGASLQIPVYGKAKRYTVSWAQLVCRYDLNVMAAFLRDGNEVAEVYLEHVEAAKKQPFDIVTKVFEAFEDFLGDSATLWENYPEWSQYSSPLPDCNLNNVQELKRELYRHAVCDPSLSKAVKSIDFKA